MWSCSRKNDKRPHLTEALWLSCGAAGMKVGSTTYLRKQVTVHVVTTEPGFFVKDGIYFFICVHVQSKGIYRLTINEFATVQI